MSSPWVASLIAIFVWWFSTGAILVAVRRADRLGTHGMTVFMGLPLLALGAWAVSVSLMDVSVMGAYIGFAGALAIWGWIELAFLAGVITGPMRDDCPSGLAARDRFFRAFQTVAYHELALTLGLWGLVIASDGAENRIALATYLVLFLARILAKLNLFYGVPRINLEFVPDRLVHLKSYFRRGPVTLVFPVAITVLTAMAGLALLEHWLMVVPLPDAKLWRWMLPAPKTMTEEER